MTAKDHNKLLGIFFLINGGLSVVGGVFAVLIYAGMGAFMISTGRESEAQAFGGVMLVLSVIVGVIIAAFAGFYLFTGWKIYKEQSIGRVLGIVASCLCLLSFPLGTALGVYGLWFMFGDQGKMFYEGGNMVSNPPPPPNSWQ